MKSLLLTFIGTIFLILGIIGVLLPVLPTTPFILLSAACYGNTPKLQAKIKNLPFFKEYFRSYEEKTGIPVKTLLISLLFLWISIILSIVLLDSLHMKIFLGIILLSVTIHLLWMSEPIRKLRNNNKKTEEFYDDH